MSDCRENQQSMLKRLPQPIDLTRDESNGSPPKKRRGNGITSLPTRMERLSLDLSDDSLSSNTLKFEDEWEEDTTEEFALRLLTEDEVAQFTRLYGRAVSIEYDTLGPHETVTTESGAVLGIGTCVELSDGDFLCIQHISRIDSMINVRGILLRLFCCMDGLMPRRWNELCAMLKVAEGCEDPALDDYLVTRPISDVVAIRDITFTNHAYPRHSYRDREESYLTKEDIWERGPLVCRQKVVEICDTRNRKVSGLILLQLKAEECTETKASTPLFQRRYFRDTSYYSDGYMPGQEDADRLRQEFIDLTSDESDEDSDVVEVLSVRKLQNHSPNQSVLPLTIRHSLPVRQQDPRLESTQPGHREQSANLAGREGLTYGEFCVGAGGWTRGAIRNGLEIKFLLDKWDTACESASRSYPETRVMHMDISEFLVNTPGDFRVDILHISYPCRPHSPAYTHGSCDPEDIDALFSLDMILKRCRPRVVTFEQTPGITWKNGGDYYFLILRTLAAAGYSVRANSLFCDRFGNCHKRERLFIIASCPGETLPHFPKPTHGNSPGLQPFVTIKDRLNSLRGFNIPRHMRQFTLKTHDPYNANQPLLGCITKSGGEGDKHPDGGRTFNLQELAAMADFDPRHVFVGTKTQIREQIGNAVPACISTAIIAQIVKTMRETDRKLTEVGVIDMIEIDD